MTALLVAVVLTAAVLAVIVRIALRGRRLSYASLAGRR